jgi:hypothetical protein
MINLIATDRKRLFRNSLHLLLLSITIAKTANEISLQGLAKATSRMSLKKSYVT